MRLKRQGQDGRTTGGEKDEHMALTREFKETVQARAQRDPRFREALEREGREIVRRGG